MRVRVIAFFTVLALAAVPFLAKAQTYNAVMQATTHNTVEMTNSTGGAWVWVTAYAKPLSDIRASFCVDPLHKKSVEVGSGIYEVRVEVMSEKGCVGKRLLDGLRGYPSGSGHTYPYYVHAVGNGYVYNNTP